jgi:hypothetical protein
MPRPRALHRCDPVGVQSASPIGAAHVIAAVLVAGVITACGGGGPLSHREWQQMDRAWASVAAYCTQRTLGAADLAPAAAGVDTAIRLWREHPDALYQPGPGAPRRTMREWLWTMASTLAEGQCASDQAQKINRALADSTSRGEP